MYLSPRFWMTGWNFLANLPKPCGLFCAANVKNYWRCAYFAIFTRAILPFARTILWGTTTGTTYTTMQLFPLLKLSCIFIMDDNSNNLYNHAVVLVVLVVVYFYFGRQREQLIQPCSCSRCYSCRVFLFWATTGITCTTMQLSSLFTLSCNSNFCTPFRKRE